WSNVHDLLKYVAMELALGKLPGGKRYLGEDALLARQAPQVAMSKDQSYGMGLIVDRTWGIPVVHHGGDLIGFHSDMIWLPDHNVGAVVLTNGDPGWQIRGAFQRKLLEVLFDGHSVADPQVATAARSFYESLAAERKLFTVPADPRRGRQARRPLHQPGARRDRRAQEGQGHGVRLRRVRQRGRLAQQPRRHPLLHHHRPRHDRPRIRGRRGERQADPDDPRLP